MKAFKLNSLLLFYIFNSTQSWAHQLEIPLVVRDFKSAEDHNTQTLGFSLMRKLGAKALFSAKILEIDLSSIFIEKSVIYFRLKNLKDTCKQSFINEMDYIVHTKCYRNQRELLNFIKIFPK